MSELPVNDERLMTSYFDQNTVLHLHRYALVRELVAGRDVLDIACGEGYGSMLLAQQARSVVGADIEPAVVEHAAAKYRAPNLRFAVGNAAEIALPTASFDVVVSFETLEHHDRHEDMMREVRRVLKPGGVFIVSTPDKQHFSDDTGHRNAFHVKELYADQFAALIGRHFPVCRYYVQGPMFGSLIVSDAGINASQEFVSYSGDHAAVVGKRSLAKPPFRIAVASDADVPELPDSLFDGWRVLERWVREADRAPWLENRVEGLGRELAELQASMSFRLGRCLLWPLRRLRGQP